MAHTPRMISMTGFGQGSASDARGTATVQISAVNNRSLAIHLRSDLHDLALEETVRQELKAAVARGSINAQVSWLPVRALSADPGRLDELEHAWRELAARAKSLGAPVPALEVVAAAPRGARAAGPGGGARPPPPPPRQGAGETVEPLLRVALAQALEGLRGMRAREGAALARDIAAHARELRHLHSGMRAAASGRTAAYRDSLATRLREVLQGQAAVTPEHLVRELALHAERIDVSEELVRLAAHLEALDTLIASRDELLGRKLEFLLQECGREVNTVGAKANDAGLTALVLEAKYAIEQMKEQVANIA